MESDKVIVTFFSLQTARKVRSPPPTKKPEEPEEQIYAEILEQPAQRQTAISHSAPAYAGISKEVFLRFFMVVDFPPVTRQA